MTLLIPQHSSTITLDFCSAVEFSSLFSLLKKKKIILRFFSFFLINHMVYPYMFLPPYQPSQCCGVFLFVCIGPPPPKKGKKKIHFRFFFFFFFSSLSFSFSLSFFGFCFGYIQLHFLLFLPAVAISEYIQTLSTHIYSSLLFYFFSLFSNFFNPLLHPFLFSFPSLLFFPFSLFLFSPFPFLLSPSKLNC